MPRSLCRNAGRLPNCAAFRRSNLGNVSNDPPSAISVSTQKPARWFAPAYGDLRPSGSSHGRSAYFPSQYKGSKVLQVLGDVGFLMLLPTRQRRVVRGSRPLSVGVGPVATR